MSYDSLNLQRNILCCRERTRTNFFSVMRKRLQSCNPVKYSNRVCLDNDLRVLATTCKHKVPQDTADLEEMVESYRSKSSSLKVESGLSDIGFGNSCPRHLIYQI